MHGSDDGLCSILGLSSWEGRYGGGDGQVLATVIKGGREHPCGIETVSEGSIGFVSGGLSTGAVVGPEATGGRPGVDGLRASGVERLVLLITGQGHRLGLARKLGTGGESGGTGGGARKNAASIRRCGLGRPLGASLDTGGLIAGGGRYNVLAVGRRGVTTFASAGSGSSISRLGCRPSTAQDGFSRGFSAGALRGRPDPLAKVGPLSGFSEPLVR